MAMQQEPQLEVLTIYKAYIRPLCKAISPQNMVRNIVQYSTSVLGSWNSHWMISCRPPWILGRWEQHWMLLWNEADHPVVMCGWRVGNDGWHQRLYAQCKKHAYTLRIFISPMISSDPIARCHAQTPGLSVSAVLWECTIPTQSWTAMLAC